jgi:hypothetical protein
VLCVPLQSSICISAVNLQLPPQPRLREGAVPNDGIERNSQYLSSLFDIQAPEIAQLYHLSLARIHLCQAGECVVKRDHFARLNGNR